MTQCHRAPIALARDSSALAAICCGLIVALLITGCGPAPAPSRTEIKNSIAEKEATKAEADKKKRKPKYWDEQPENQEEVAQWKDQADWQAAKGNGGGSRQTRRRMESSNAAALIRERLELEISDALQVRPTVLIWVVDRSKESTSIRGSVLPVAKELATRFTKPDLQADDAAKQFSTAVVTYGDETEVRTAEPLTDLNKVATALNISQSAQGNHQAFAAVAKAAQAFAPYRQRGYELLLVLVAADAAADDASFDSAVKAVRDSGVLMFAVGPKVPFFNQQAAGPIETFAPERIRLPLFNSQGDLDLSDAGFGPYQLERLCSAAGGKYLRLRDAATPGWTIESSGEIRADLAKKYAPEYASAEKNQALSNENKAIKALQEAAALPPADLLRSPRTNFRTGDEARLARELSMAQRKSADAEPGLRRLHETLTAGVADRAKLTSPRLQAEFDLALGRVLAARAQNDGYNFMLATLKNGKAFAKAGSTEWELVPAAGIAGSSQLDKMCSESRELLQRVVTEHAGTPWAALAADALENPSGWEWQER